MAPKDGSESPKARFWRTLNVWAEPEIFEGNPVRQLVVPAGEFATISGEVDGLQIENNLLLKLLPQAHNFYSD